jgi:broad specificity phosphatase PhoE
MRDLKRIARLTLSTAAMIALSAATLAAQATTVIIVRHAEKAAAPAADPPLTPAGEARAAALWDAVKDAGVSAIITTQYLRTKGTAQPTAAALSITPTVVNAAGSAHPQDVAAAVKKNAGRTVLVVGHSNTVPAIVEALGAKKPPEICDAEYDNLFIVTLAADGKAGVVRSKFGARSEPCPGAK